MLGYSELMSKLVKVWALFFAMCLPIITFGFEVGPTSIETIASDAGVNGLPELTFTISDTFSDCPGAGDSLVVPYARGSLSETYLNFMLMALSAGHSVVLEYEFVASECNLVGLRMR